MYAGLATLVTRRPKTVLLVTLLLMLAAGPLAGTLQSRLDTGGFDDPDSDSSRAAAVLDETFGQGEANLVLVVSTPKAVDDPEIAAAGRTFAERLAAEEGIGNVVSYWTTGGLPTLRSEDGTKTLIAGRILGNTNAQTEWVTDILPKYTGEVDGLTVRAGGMAVAGKEMTEQSAQDAVQAELIVFPVVLVLLLLIFGNFRAAVIPLAISFVVLLVGMACMWLLTTVTDVSVFVMNMVSVLGLGLAIDYSLLLVSRFREEMTHSGDRAAAVRVTLATAGRTVAFSALTVAIVLSGITVLPFYSLSSLGWSGIVTSLLAAAASVTVAPALLYLMGDRVAQRRRFGRSADAKNITDGVWHRLATFVMRRPVGVGIAVIAFLLLLGTPFLQFKGGEVDERVLPADSESYQVSTEIRESFNATEGAPFSVVAPKAPPTADRAAEVTDYGRRLSALPGVARVDTETGSFADGEQVAPPNPLSVRFTKEAATYLSVVPEADPRSDDAKKLAREIRDVDAPFDVLVGGGAAIPVDALDSLKRSLPLAIAIVAVAMLALLFLLTGSVILPLTAVVLSGLSMTATFGALVFIFQEGRMMWLVGDFNATGATIWVVPVMLFAFAFALAMDYQVFLLSRIQEEYRRTGETTSAVASGLERIGRVVTAAAVLISIVFLALVPSGVAHVKALGLGVALAVLIDATLVRGALLPAFMRLTGRWNWWAPKPLAWLHARVGLRESGDRQPATTREEALTSTRSS